VQNRQTGHGIEAGRNEIVVFAYSNRVRVGIIRIKDGVLVSAVAAIGHPNFRHIWLAGLDCEHHGKYDQCDDRIAALS
jgi:hypothetical protein